MIIPRDHMDLATGVASIEMAAEDDLFYRVYQEVSGVEVKGLHDILVSSSCAASCRVSSSSGWQLLSTTINGLFSSVISATTRCSAST